MTIDGKICFVVGGLPFGGIAGVLLNVSKEFQKRGLDFVVVNVSGTGEKISDFEYQKLPLVNLCDSVDTLKTYRVDTIFKLRKFIKDAKPAIIHTMEFSGDYFGRLAAVGLNIPVVTHIHNIKSQRKYRRKVANKLLSRKTDLFLCVSEAVSDVVKRDHSATKRRIVLYNALNPESFKGKQKLYPYKRNPEVPIVACVGRLVKQKNFDLVIKALKLLEQRSVKVVLWIIGEGPERKNLESLTRDLGLEEKVTFFGYRKDVIDLLTKTDILLMPSQYEGLGMTFLEAMYFGIPAVISEHVPAKEIASDSCLICDTTPDSIAEKIATLLSDDELYENLSKNAEKRSREFTIDKYVDKLLDIYEKVLANKSDKQG